MTPREVLDQVRDEVLTIRGHIEFTRPEHYEDDRAWQACEHIMHVIDHYRAAANPACEAIRAFRAALIWAERNWEPDEFAAFDRALTGSGPVGTAFCAMCDVDEEVER